LINFRQWWSREWRNMRRRIYIRREGKKGRRKEETKLCHLHRFFNLV
jgi:hypothetical protein